MSETYDRAMDRVRDEMARAKMGGVQGVGEVVTDLLPQMPALAAAVMEDGKTLEGCFKELEKYAREHKKGNSYYMPPGEAMGLILKYYGIESGEVEAPKVTTEVSKVTTATGEADAIHGVPTGDAGDGPLP